MKLLKKKKKVWFNMVKANNDKIVKERCMKVYEEEKMKTKRCISRREKL